MGAAWGTSEDKLWVVGDHGTILHWNGVTWALIASPTHRHLRSIWGATETDIRAVGDGATILHYDGVRWTQVPNAALASPYRNLLAVHGAGPDRAWAVGIRGLLLAWNGTEWLRIEPPESVQDLMFESVFATAPDDAWIGINDGTLLRWNGIEWSVFGRPVESAIYGFWQAAVDDVWAVGGTGNVLRWNGREWQDRSVPQEMRTDEINRSGTSFLRSVWGTGPRDVWVNHVSGRMLHWDGEAWELRYTNPTFDVPVLWGSSARDLWAFGEFGEMQHFDGVAWQARPRPSILGLVHRLASAPNGDGWALAARSSPIHGASQWNGAEWVPVDWTGLVGFPPTLEDIWLDADEQWTVGTEVLSRREGRWRREPTPADNPFLTSVVGASATDLWAAGYRHNEGAETLVVSHFDGSTWVDEELPPEATGRRAWDLWRGPDDTIWVALDGLWTLDPAANSTWTSITEGFPEDDTPSSIWGVDAASVWVTTARGGSLRCNRTRCGAAFPSDVGSITYIDGTSETNVWAVASSGALGDRILRYLGNELVLDVLPPGLRISAIEVTEDAVRVATTDGLILRKRLR